MPLHPTPICIDENYLVFLKLQKTHENVLLITTVQLQL